MMELPERQWVSRSLSIPKSGSVSWEQTEQFCLQGVGSADLGTSPRADQGREEDWWTCSEVEGEIESDHRSFATLDVEPK